MDPFHRGTVRLRLYHDDTRSMHDRANPWVGAARPDHGTRVTENRISIWSVEAGAYGIDLPYHGASVYTDAETAEQKL